MRQRCRADRAWPLRQGGGTSVLDRPKPGNLEGIPGGGTAGEPCGGATGQGAVRAKVARKRPGEERGVKHYGPGKHPNSRANLRPPWRPGTSGNRNGRPTGGRWLTKRNFKKLLRGDSTILDRFLKEYPDSESAESKEKAVAVVMKERVQCSACRHAELPVIDGLLTLGIPIRVVARNFGLTRSSLDRHRRHHLPTFASAETARKVVGAAKLLGQVVAQLKRASGLALFDETRNALLDEAWTAFEKLWTAFEQSLGDSADDRLRFCLADACLWLYRVQARIPWIQAEENLEDVRHAIAALESWRDGTSEL